MTNLEYTDTWSRVVIWGAATLGIECLTKLRELGIEVTCFVDRHPPRKGMIEGIRVWESQEFINNIDQLSHIDAIIFAMWSDSRPMQNALRETGFKGAFANFHEGMSKNSIKQHKTTLNFSKVLLRDSRGRDRDLIDAAVENLPANVPLAIYGNSNVTKYLLDTSPALSNRAKCVLDSSAFGEINDIPVYHPNALSRPHIVWITAQTYLESLDARHHLEKFENCRPYDWADIADLLPEANKPQHAFVKHTGFHVYPLRIPPIEFNPDLDFLLVDLPARFLGMLPNGLGYVHNILKTTGCHFQTADLDMIFYHRWHAHRLLDDVTMVFSPDGRELPTDPWGVNTAEDFWYDRDCVEYFRPEIERTVSELLRANPKILGLSLHGTNRMIATEVIRRMREHRPEMIIVVGGYDCNNPKTSPHVIPDYDYMVIFEAETSLPPLVHALLSGRRHFHIPGVVSKKSLSSPLGNSFVAAELQEDIDTNGFPTYEWADPALYRNHNGFQLIPIILSRGCRWSRCTFCGERFHWRRRDPMKVADEIEWFVERGGRTFHFNDSDLSGDPEAVKNVCEEVIKRGLNDITMFGQLRVQKGYNAEYFKILKQAGFSRLRFGIDTWAKNTLKLQKKGYTLGMIEEVLGFTKQADIQVGINLVIGIPGETDDDIEEMIDNIIRNQHLFDLIENLNTLLLTTASVYWTDPGKFGIVLHEDKDALERMHPVVIPSNLWHSVDPYIDQNTRKRRLERILSALSGHDIYIGGYAERRAKQLMRDEMAHDEFNRRFD